ncbi:MAG: radical SAM protein [bacterium]
MDLAATALGAKALEGGIRLVINKPVENIGRIVRWLEKLPMLPHHKEDMRSIREFLDDQESNWYKLVARLLAEADPMVKTKFITNLVLNSNIFGGPRQREWAARLGCSVPGAVLIDPTGKCNLRCTGCWAGDYSREDELDYATLDRVLTECEELGIYLVIMSGGEPVIRKDDIVRLAAKHSAQMFHLFTNGILIDDVFVRDMKRLGNIMLAFSIEGFRRNTDERRGEGVYDRVMEAMARMRESGLIYGVSVTYGRQNTEELASEEFIDMLVAKGASFAWYFTYIPIGRDVDLTMMATPEQRSYMYKKILEYRQTKPIFLMDFWNDGVAAGGCIAGGRRYLHINAHGDVEPCAFVHYATCNIKDTSLPDALRSPLLRAYQRRQPFSPNLRRPCPLIDVPDAMVEMVREAGARSTQLHPDETAGEFAGKIRPYADAWAVIADREWAGER